MKKNITIALFLFVFFFNSCTKPYESIVGITWEGEITRIIDNKVLSDVKLKLSNDTLYLFSNAVFGADNDTLLLQNYSKSDSVFTFLSNTGNTFILQYTYEKEKDSEYLCFYGSDYYIFLIKSDIDVKDVEALAFYRNKKVPRECFMYLDGAYEGEMEMENQLANTLLTEMGGVKIKLVFVDDLKVKIYFKNAFFELFSNSTEPTFETVSYSISDNKLYLHNKSKLQVVEVKDEGETLVLATDDSNIILRKIY